ncbi:MAG: MOSC domain-containing protein [Gemmatimonadetes bacterium]|nr:MOSC domain-containing protein [Gemmatimonadota bacterium]
MSNRLAGLHLYPLKSAAAFSVHHAEVDPIGLVGDRRWMLVDPRARPLTQRELPRLARVHAIPAPAGGLEIVALGMPMLQLDVPGPESPVVQTELHGRPTEGWLAAPDAADWLTDFLETPCRLLYVPPPLARAVAAPWGLEHDRTAFTDGFPFLLIGEGSLAALNDRLGRPVPMDRFRPNLVVSGTEPFEEDEWQRVRIGSLEFRVVKPCPRCVVTTVDQATGARDPAGEPLATLATFRKLDGKVWFGMNLIHEGAGQLRLGDPVEVISCRDARAT